MSKNVVVLLGGWSSEREVSLSTGKGCAEALERRGYRVTAIDVSRNLSALLAELNTARPDVIFNALHGRFGEDGCMQGLLDMLAIPYTHSGRLASALAMNKVAARRLFADEGLPMAEGWLLRQHDIGPDDEPPRPYVVKPVGEGSSVGVTLVFEGDRSPLFGAEWTFGEEVLIEAFVPGREIQVAVMGGKSLGTVEIKTDRQFYDYVAKYTPGASEHLVPAPIDPEAHAEVMRLAERAHICLGCQGVSRVDFRYDDTAGEPGRFALLEVNTQPGMTPTSLVPEIAEKAGISFEELVSLMVENASCDS